MTTTFVGSREIDKSSGPNNGVPPPSRARTLMSLLGSPQHREHEVDDPVALDTYRRVAEQDVF